MAKLICPNCKKIIVEDVEKYLEKDYNNYMQCPYCLEIFYIGSWRENDKESN